MSPTPDRVNYQTDPSQYKHWKLSFEGPVAGWRWTSTRTPACARATSSSSTATTWAWISNSTMLINRIRFEHPEVRTVVAHQSLKDKVFCSGANIFMLGVSSHAWKVNFCKFTNETRNGLRGFSQQALAA